MGRSVRGAELRSRYESEGAFIRRYDSASFWDARYHRRRFRPIVKTLRPMLSAAMSFLDVGCGTGEYLSVANGLGIAAVFGVDLSGEYCRRARETCPTAKISQASADSLPFGDRSIDVVLCTEVLEHLPGNVCVRAIQELQRVTRRHLVVTTPNSDALIRRVARRRWRQHMELLDEAVGHINLVSARELTGMFEDGSWRSRSFTVMHILPPVVGEATRAPRMTSPLVGAAESLANRVLPRSGNVMILALERPAHASSDASKDRRA